MNFWANKLGQRQAPPAPVAPHVYQPPPQPHLQQRPWWDESPTPQPQLQQPQEQFQIPRQARGARAAQMCPECGSGSYMAVAQDGPSVMVGPGRARCFDCGYPYIQSGSGGIGIKGNGEVTASRQVHDGTSQVMPGFIAHLQ